MVQARPAVVVLLLLIVGALAGPQRTIAAVHRPMEPAPTADAALADGQVALDFVASGLSSPVGIVNAGDGTDRLFVVEQRGTVRVISAGKLQAGYFLDIRTVSGGLTSGGERGLLGLAFHPSYETNRKLFAYFTRGDGDITVAEFTANAAGTSASVSSVDPLLTIEHSSATNHNGGQLLFGPDGYLYVLTGDGGGAGDPGENAQDRTSLLGKTLRIAPNLSGGYSVPSDNPYATHATFRHEIWSYGLRNPWRASFDRANGTLWIADVGQGTQEEVNREAAGHPGRNYGWDCREGSVAYNDPSPGISCSGLTFTNPTVVYGHTGGNCSITGGYVYRGEVFEDLVNWYILADYCSGRIWTLPSGAGSPTLTLHQDTELNITSFGESESGEIYLTDQANGRVYRVVAPPFRDVVSSPFIDDITWLYYADITQGCGSGLYCPTSSVTRAQMASFLVRAFDLPPSGTDSFTDDDGSIHEADINALAAAGVTTGCAPGLYCPGASVRRDEMATFLARVLDLPSTTTDYFTDDDGSFHEDNINRVAAAGITGGCGGTLYCPAKRVTREQMAAFLHRALD